MDISKNVTVTTQTVFCLRYFSVVTYLLWCIESELCNPVPLYLSTKISVR